MQEKQGIADKYKGFTRRFRGDRLWVMFQLLLTVVVAVWTGYYAFREAEWISPMLRGVEWEAAFMCALCVYYAGVMAWRLVRVWDRP